MNQVSSRSHSILTFIVMQEDLKRSDTANIISKLRLVDLAGSERQSNIVSANTTHNAVQFKEAVEINKSLFTLRQVITALTENGTRGGGPGQKSNSIGSVSGAKNNNVPLYVPYRESKLTTILK